MTQQEILNAIALTRLSNVGQATVVELCRTLGSATAVMQHRHDIGSVVPDVHPRLAKALRQMDEPLKRAEAELLFDEQHAITPLVITDEAYPARLRECSDAPLVVFYRGTADLNQHHVLNIIGTRHCTSYGQDLIRRFLSDLHQLCPNVLVVSGLAYGVDICAHREALSNGFQTVGVLAHGLDDLYPPRHKETARQMLTQGGLITEYMTHTQPYPQNFVQRNRIVAGLSDACLLVESAVRGGGLITARIAMSYDRSVFAFPGAVGATYSEGCNQLIRDNGAALITSAEDFVQAMGWETDKQLAHAREAGIERNLFPQLSSEEQAVVDALQQTNDQPVSMLAVRANLPVGRLTALLFELEMKGVVRSKAGGVCHLLL